MGAVSELNLEPDKGNLMYSMMGDDEGMKFEAKTLLPAIVLSSLCLLFSSYVFALGPLSSLYSLLYSLPMSLP